MNEFTGYYDKHGNPIYVGSKLRIHPGFGCEWSINEGIVYVNESKRGQLYNDKDKLEYYCNRWDLLFIDMECWCEVID